MPLLTLKDIETAQTRIKGAIRETPLRWSETISRMAGFSVHVKLENQQKTGSFKLRGAANRILGGEIVGQGVVAASAGNHAQGVAYAAQQAGLSATIVMPQGAPITKADATSKYGARVIQQGSTYDECYQVARQLAEEENLQYIHAFDDPLIIAGQGTIGLEILAEHPGIRQIIVPVGGGGLISGIALAAKNIDPHIRVVGIQAQGADAVFQTFRHRQLTESESVVTIADGIAVKRPGKLTTELILEYVDNILTVSDEEIASAILVALERLKTLVEGAGAAALAAALYRSKYLDPVPTAVVLSGGNVDVNLIAQLIQRGLLKTGRLAMMQVNIPDKPGNLQRVLNTVSGQGANIISIVHERLGQDLPLGWTQVTLSLETRNRQHIDSLVLALGQQGLKVEIV
ncbi:MAG: threonine ammonia-lyase [Bacillota bacterium]|jgi:threonine dehydratase